MAKGSAAAADHVKQAIQALYGPDAAQQAAANAWLNSLVGSPSAWEAAVHLLEPANSSEVQFFSANLLLTKVRSEWGGLPDEARQQLTAAASGKLQALVGSAATLRVVLQRLALALAAMAVRSSPEATRDFVEQALALAASAGSGGNAAAGELGAELLQAVVEEGERVGSYKRRAALVAALLAAAPRVLHLLRALLTGALTPPGGVAPVAAALKCLYAWLDLYDHADGSGCGAGAMSIGALHAAQPHLLAALLAALASGAPGVAKQAGSCLVLLLELQGTEGTEEERSALQSAVVALLALRPRIRQGEPAEHTALAAAQVATAVAEKATLDIVGGFPESAALADMMLECLVFPSRAVADAALRYFDAVNTVPLDQRHPQLRAPLYQKMMGPLLAQAAYPPGFTSWEQCVDDDEADFDRWRNHTLDDAFDVPYAVLRSAFLHHLGQAMASASSWQASEAALFALLRVAPDMVLRVRNGSPALKNMPGADLTNGITSGEGRHSAAVRQDAERTHEALRQLFGQLVAGGPGGVLAWGSPWLLQTVVRLVGAFSWWYAAAEAALRTQEAGLLQPSLTFLLQAYALPQTKPVAAASFHSLCVRCKSALKQPQVLSGLMAAAEGALAPPPTPAAAPEAGQQARVAVVEGLARVIAELPASEAAAAGQRLIAPPTHTLQHLLASTSGREVTGEVAAAAAGELLLIASAVRFMEFTAAEGAAHPALAVLQEAWPQLSALMAAPPWQAAPLAVAAVCDVYRRTLLAIKKQAGVVVPALAGALLPVMQRHRVPACLDTLALLAEMCGALPEAAGLLSQGLAAAWSGVSQPSLANSSQEVWEYLVALYNMADRYALFAPGILLASPQLEQLLRNLPPLLRMRERDIVAAAVSCLADLMKLSNSLTGTAQQTQCSPLHSGLATQGKAITVSLLWAACDTGPKPLMRPIASSLYSLLVSKACGSSSHEWLVTALQLPDLPGRAEGRLTAEDCSRFCAVALRNPPLPAARFAAMVGDFGAIARGEGDRDLLLAYEFV